MFVIQKPDSLVEPIVAKQAFVTRQQPLLDKVAKTYGRDSKGLCVKVFYGNPMTEGMDLKEALWGDNPTSKDEPRKRLQDRSIKNGNN